MTRKKSKPDGFLQDNDGRKKSEAGKSATAPPPQVPQFGNFKISIET